VRAAGGLQTLGVTPGDIVCVVAPNHVHYLVTFYAITLIRSTFQPLNPLYTTVTGFTCTIQGVADSLFCKHITLKCRPGFANPPIVRNKQWFDHECVHAKRLYVDALNCFNHCKSLENRENLCTCMFKSQYKKLIKKNETHIN